MVPAEASEKDHVNGGTWARTVVMRESTGQEKGQVGSLCYWRIGEGLPQLPRFHIK
jgi:hypothetical protein